MNKSLCALPFLHIMGNPDGKVKLCCLSKDNINANLGHDKIETFFNSDYMKNVRKEMINGNRIPECTNCYLEEDAGGNSQRITYTQEWLTKDPALDSVIKNAEQNDYYVDPKIQYFDFRFGNMCNLKCRSCGPFNSIQILKEVKEITDPNKIKFYGDTAYLDSINDWYQTDTFKENFKSQADNIKQIYFTGGEPTIIEQNYEMLEYFVNTGNANKITLIFSSNMTNIQDRFIKLITEFDKVRFLASCEGYGAMHEYLRFPANWNSFEKNIKKLAELDNNKIQICCTPVIQSVNLLSITDFFKWIENINNSFGYNRIQTLPIVLTDPKYLDLEILPTELKLEGLHALETYVDSTPRLKNDVHFMSRFNLIKTKCLTNNHNPELLKSFKLFTEMLDKQRNQSLENVNSKLYYELRKY